MNKFRYSACKCIECEKIIALFVRKALAEICYQEVWHVDRYLIISPFCVIGWKLWKFFLASDEDHQDSASLLCCKIILKCCGEYVIGQYLIGIIESEDVASALG